MNPTSSSTQPSDTSTSASAGWGGYETHRRLDEPVLPSAAEEVRVGTGNPSDPSSQSHRQAGAAWPFPDGSEGQSGSPWLTRMEDQLAHYVAVQPIKATLMALGVGALAALAWGQRTRRARGARRG